MEKKTNLTAYTLDSAAEDISAVLELADGLASVLFVLCRAAKEYEGEISSALYAAAHLATTIKDELTDTEHAIDRAVREGTQ